MCGYRPFCIFSFTCGFAFMYPMHCACVCVVCHVLCLVCGVCVLCCVWCVCVLCGVCCVVWCVCGVLCCVLCGVCCGVCVWCVCVLCGVSVCGVCMCVCCVVCGVCVLCCVCCVVCMCGVLCGVCTHGLFCFSIHLLVSVFLFSSPVLQKSLLMSSLATGFISSVSMWVWHFRTNLTFVWQSINRMFIYISVHCNFLGATFCHCPDVYGVCILLKGTIFAI